MPSWITWSRSKEFDGTICVDSWDVFLGPGRRISNANCRARQGSCTIVGSGVSCQFGGVVLKHANSRIYFGYSYDSRQLLLSAFQFTPRCETTNKLQNKPGEISQPHPNFHRKLPRNPAIEESIDCNLCLCLRSRRSAKVQSSKCLPQQESM